MKIMRTFKGNIYSPEVYLSFLNDIDSRSTWVDSYIFTRLTFNWVELMQKEVGAIFADTIIFFSFFHYCLALRMAKSLSKGIFLFIVIVKEPAKHRGSEKAHSIDEVKKLFNSWQKQRTNVSQWYKSLVEFVTITGFMFRTKEKKCQFCGSSNINVFWRKMKPGGLYCSKNPWHIPVCSYESL